MSVQEKEAGATARRDRNHPGQYDDLVAEWWKTGGAFAALHWLAQSRAGLIPEAKREGATLVDLGCGGGVLAPYVRGYRHIGVDFVESAAVVAARHGVTAVRADVSALPLDDRCAEVVVAGEIFEHVADLENTVGELARVLRPGGTLVFDTLSDGWWSRFSMVTVGERLPGGPPPGIHDPNLFVPPFRLRSLCAENGIEVSMWGLRPAAADYLRFLLFRDRPVRLLRTRSLRGLYQGVGRKAAV